MLCGVTATLGSNPSATATAARPHWGRAVLLCIGNVLCCCVAVWPHGCSGRRRARSLGVPVGGGPPARSPHASLKARSGRSRGPPWPCRHPPAPRPGPATALHTSEAWCAGVWLGASTRCPARPCRRPWVSHLGPVGQMAHLSETAIAFARSCSCGIETGIAFAGAGRASNETGIAFAGENWVFLARFSLVLVLPVSRGVV